METKNLYPTLAAAVLALGILVGGITTCTQKTNEARLKCVDSTGEPLECLQLFKNQ